MTNKRVGYRVFSGFLASALSMSSGLLSLSSAYAEMTQIEKAPLKTCIHTIGKVDRLACFDSLFETPVEVLSAGEALPEFIEEMNAPDGPLERQAKFMETARASNDRNWQFRFGSIGHPAKFRWDDIIEKKQVAKRTKPRSDTIPEKTQALARKEVQQPVIEPGLTNVYLSMKEFRSADAPADEKPATLVLSCVADITTAALILGEPQDRRRVPLRILMKGQQNTDDVWQSAESKRVLISPRGLTSIAHINRWAQVERVQFEIETNGQSRAYLFEMANLRSMLGPIRRACHW